MVRRSNEQHFCIQVVRETKGVECCFVDLIIAFNNRFEIASGVYVVKTLLIELQRQATSWASTQVFPVVKASASRRTGKTTRFWEGDGRMVAVSLKLKGKIKHKSALDG